MELIMEGMKRRIGLLLRGDREVVEVVLLTLQVSGTATLLSLFFGVGIGALMGLRQFAGRTFFLSIVNTAMGLPPVVVGLFVTLLLWRSGLLGALGLLYTPTAMILAQAIIATPIIAGISVAAFQSLSQELRLQILSLGARSRQLVWLLIKEARLQLLAAVMAGFGGVVSEVGASMMVGGNIRGCTRVLTTATVMETAKGNFELAIALSVILLLLAYAVTVALTSLQQRGHKW
jgi:tungstate transport system permease protein